MARVVDYSQLFLVDDPLANQPYRLEPFGQDWINSKAVELFTGQQKPPEPVMLKPMMGGRPSDILWSGLTPIICISQRIVNLLIDEGFKGWSTYPVEVYGKGGELLPGYHGLSVTSSVGRPDLSRSRMAYRVPPTPAGKPLEQYQGLYFDEAKWDGSDIFRIEVAFITVTQVVRDVFKREKITNIRFTPLPEYRMLAAVFKR